MNKTVNLIKAGLKGSTYLAMVMAVVIAGCVENKPEGSYKVSLNGQTIAQGTGNFAPATPTTYTAPQFGIYNHGGNQENFKFTHKEYGRYTYNQTPNFDQINSINQAKPPRGLRVLSGISLIPGLVLS